MKYDANALQQLGFIQCSDGEWRKPKRHQVNSAPSSPVAQPPVRHEPLATPPRAQGHCQRYAVCITSVRSRLIDPDNLCGKYFTDCLRYAGLIPDDTAAIVDYSIRQEKAASKKAQRTIIIVTPLSPALTRD